uniref:Uncharacterized protein n=1 Tax=Romanomermis culicivorax TaxID=13658 RepID=A0A915JIN5_ROMCU
MYLCDDENISGIATVINYVGEMQQFPSTTGTSHSQEVVICFSNPREGDGNKGCSFNVKLYDQISSLELVNVVRNVELELAIQALIKVEFQTSLNANCVKSLDSNNISICANDPQLTQQMIHFLLEIQSFTYFGENCLINNPYQKQNVINLQGTKRKCIMI